MVVFDGKQARGTYVIGDLICEVAEDVKFGKFQKNVVQKIDESSTKTVHLKSKKLEYP